MFMRLRDFARNTFAIREANWHEIVKMKKNLDKVNATKFFKIKRPYAAGLYEHISISTVNHKLRFRKTSEIHIESKKIKTGEL